MDYDAIVIGSGPAGLTAATKLAEGKARVLLLEKESFGGWVMNLETVMHYPAQGQKAVGSVLASEMIERARAAGVRMEQGEVDEIESYSRTRSVSCAGGKVYSCSVVVIAGGLRSKALGVPGEAQFQGKGMIHCAACDASLYQGKVVAVCGGGRAGVVEAMLLAKFAAKVYLIEAQADLSASPMGKERARANPKLEIRCGCKPVEVRGKDFVTGLEVAETATGRNQVLEVDGVLVHVGFEPDTGYLREAVGLDESGAVMADERFATNARGIFVAGDLRRGSTRGVAGAVSDGAAAAAAALQELEQLQQRQ